MKPPSLICLVTDRRRLSPGAGAAESCDRLVRLVAAAARAGIDMVQVREPDLTARDLESLAERCVDAARGVRVLVNDRVDVALASGASGVHLRSDSVEGTTARAAASPGFVIGRSVHGLDEAVAASRSGALDYLIFGSIFSTASKPAGHAPAGLEALSRMCAAVPIPVLAIGGVTLERAPDVARTGAAGVAAIGLFLAPQDVPDERHVADAVTSLRRVFDTCGAVS